MVFKLKDFRGSAWRADDWEKQPVYTVAAWSNEDAIYTVERTEKRFVQCEVYLRRGRTTKRIFSAFMIS